MIFVAAKYYVVCSGDHYFSVSSYLNPASLKDPAINDVEDFKHLEQSMDQVGLNMKLVSNSSCGASFREHYKENTADRKGNYVCSENVVPQFRENQSPLDILTFL